MGGYSIELCGGAHLKNTAQIGSFKILSENGVAAGVRRIAACHFRFEFFQFFCHFLLFRQKLFNAVQKLFRCGFYQLAERADFVLLRLERLVNEAVFASYAISAEEMPIDAAREKGAMALSVQLCHLPLYPYARFFRRQPLHSP